MGNMNKAIFLRTFDGHGEPITKYFAVEIRNCEEKPYIYVEYGFVGIPSSQSHLVFAENVVEKYNEIVAEKIEEDYYKASYEYAQAFKFKAIA